MAKRKRRKASVSALKKKAWTLYSRLVRWRSRDSRDRCKCVTCGVKKHWKEMQAGHFVSRIYSATMFHDLNVNPQCPKCNVALYGQQYLYGEYLRKKHGQDIPDELYALARAGHQFTSLELTSKIEDYKAELEALGYDANA